MAAPLVVAWLLRILAAGGAVASFAGRMVLAPVANAVLRNATLRGGTWAWKATGFMRVGAPQLGRLVLTKLPGALGATSVGVLRSVGGLIGTVVGATFMYGYDKIGRIIAGANALALAAEVKKEHLSKLKDAAIKSLQIGDGEWTDEQYHKLLNRISTFEEAFKQLPEKITNLVNDPAWEDFVNKNYSPTDAYNIRLLQAEDGSHPYGDLHQKIFEQYLKGMMGTLKPPVREDFDSKEEFREADLTYRRKWAKAKEEARDRADRFIWTFHYAMEKPDELARNFQHHKKQYDAEQEAQRAAGRAAAQAKHEAQRAGDDYWDRLLKDHQSWEDK